MTDIELARRNPDISQEVISVRSNRQPLASPALTAMPDVDDRLERLPSTMVFGDFKGFGKLSDAQLPLYVDRVLGAAAAVLDGGKAVIAGGPGLWRYLYGVEQAPDGQRTVFCPSREELTALGSETMTG
jgi:hypothetical protein